MKRITVLLADDHMILREGLRALLDLEGGFAVVGEAADGLRAVELAQERRPDVAVLDIAMPLLNGLDAARRILQQVPTPPKVLILSAHADDVYLEQVAALGVSGYIVKQTSAHMLARAIRTVHTGGTFYSPAVAKRLPGEGHGTPGRAGATNRGPRALTSREREVLQRVAEGQANKWIAADLGISIKTVEKHRQGLMRKLGLHDTAGITRYAISAGIIESCVQCTIA